MSFSADHTHGCNPINNVDPKTVNGVAELSLSLKTGASNRLTSILDGIGGAILYLDFLIYFLLALILLRSDYDFV